MKKFRVTASQTACVDVYVEAATVEEARQLVLHGNDWMTDEVKNPDAWCDGHEHTRQIDEVVEVDEDGHDII